MSLDLEDLIELAKKHKITEEEHGAQLRSFAYRNKSENQGARKLMGHLHILNATELRLAQ